MFTSNPPTRAKNGGNAPAHAHLGPLAAPPDHPPLEIVAGVISADPRALKSLLLDLCAVAATDGIGRFVVVVLNNGGCPEAMTDVVNAVETSRLQVFFVSEAQQRADAARGTFGGALDKRALGRVGIASARTMLQRYVGSLMEQSPAAIGWLLDDDMRVDMRASWYLSWLPAFRVRNIDVLIGAIEGVSPNPPLHGLQGRLFDLVCNVKWLRSLEASMTLPNRKDENEALRRRFPDYYYDLSRRHTEHLDRPHWLEPAEDDETVAQAYERLLVGASGILAGAPLTRSLVVPLPRYPMTAAHASVNRGGNTFVLNHRALTCTPNPILRAGDIEVRRSDMFWAIINRYYRGLSIKAVAFPVVHVARNIERPTLDLEKVAAELIGAALYAALSEFLDRHPKHSLQFSPDEGDVIAQSAASHHRNRLQALSRSFKRMGELREQLRAMARHGELADLLAMLDIWLTPAVLERVGADSPALAPQGIDMFLKSLRQSADDYAAAPPPALDAWAVLLRGDAS